MRFSADSEKRPLSGRRVLVTGATGFIGSAVVQRLLAERVKVYCLARSTRIDRSRLRSLSGVELIEVQTFQISELRKALTGVSADVVLNLASYGVQPEDRDPDAMLEGNVGLIARLLMVTAEWPLKRFVHTGSCSEYGAPSAQEPVTEDHPLQPVSLYGAAKAASVLYGSALAAQLRMPFITLRLFGVYGLGERPHRLIPYVIDRLKRNQLVDLTEGEQVRDLLYIDDVVEAFVAAACSDRLNSYQVYNVCSGIPVRVRDVAEAVAGALNKPRDLLQWGERAYRPDEVMWIVGDSSRFVRETQWHQRISLSEGIRRMIGAATGGRKAIA